MVRNGLRVAVMLAIMAALLWWFFSKVDGRGVIESLQHIQWAWLAGALFFTLAHYVLRAWRWRLLMAPIRAGIPFRSLLDAVLAGYAVTFLVTRVGEIVRPAYLARRERLPFASTLMTVGLDRLLDAGAIAVLLVAYLLLGPSAGPGALAPDLVGSMRSRGLAAGAVLLALFIGLALLARGRRRLLGPDLRAGGLRGTFRSLLHGLAVLETGRGLVGAGLQSLLIWLVLCAQVFCGVHAFGIELPYVASFVVIPFLALGIAMPLPGGVGGYHAAGRFALVDVLGVGENVAVTSILVLHVVSVLPAILLGSWVIARSGVSIRELLRNDRSGGDDARGDADGAGTGEGPAAPAAGLRADVEEASPLAKGPPARLSGSTP